MQGGARAGGAASAAGTVLLTLASAQFLIALFATRRIPTQQPTASPEGDPAAGPPGPPTAGVKPVTEGAVD